MGTSIKASIISMPWKKSVQHTAVKPPKKVYATMISRNTNMASLGDTSGNRVVNTEVPATSAEAT